MLNSGCRKRKKERALSLLQSHGCLDSRSARPSGGSSSSTAVCLSNAFVSEATGVRAQCLLQLSIQRKTASATKARQITRHATLPAVLLWREQLFTSPVFGFGFVFVSLCVHIIFVFFTSECCEALKDKHRSKRDDLRVYTHTQSGPSTGVKTL